MDIARITKDFETLIEVQPNGCWYFTGSLWRGYGQIGVYTPIPGLPASTRSIKAHRLAWFLVHGWLPPTLDHRCHSDSTDCPGGVTCLHRRCCNPDHLEPATAKQQVERAKSHNNRDKTHCPRNHPYDSTSSGQRRCKTCERERSRRRKAQTG